MKRTISIFAALLLASQPYVFGNQPAMAGAKPAVYDVVVYGATPGGIAAIAAAREGASAILIEPSGYIGGMTAGGLSTADTGKEETIGGISREFFTRADAKYNDPKMSAPGTAYTHGTPCELPARDASGKLFWGVTDKPWPALGTGDKLVQSYTFRVIITRNKDNLVPFPKPKNYYPKRYDLLVELIRRFPGIKFPRIVYIGWIPGGKSEINASGLIFSTDYWGGNTDYPEGDEATRARIYQDHVDYVQGLLWFLGNDERMPPELRKETQGWGLCRDEFVDNGHWPHALYVREARRMIGRYVMRQQDCQDENTKPDAIAMGGFILDSHAYQRLVTPEGTVIDEGNFDVRAIKPYQIPYRSITPHKAQCVNLLVPVCLSATHVAYGALRMEPQYMNFGHAAGVAAVAAIRADAAVQDIDVKALQAELQAAKQVLSLPPKAKASKTP
jgi:hypothetical protein